MSWCSMGRTLVIGCAVLSWGCMHAKPLPPEYMKDDATVNVLVGGEKLSLAVKHTGDAKNRGLSGISELPGDGALFVYACDTDTAFTMATTPPMQLDLDIAFFDEDERLVHVGTYKIGDSDIRPPNGASYRYVVETNARRIARYAGQEGVRLELLTGVAPGCEQVLLPKWVCPLEAAPTGAFPASFEPPRGLALQRASLVRCAQKIVECVAGSIELKEQVRDDSYCVEGDDPAHRVASGEAAHAAMWEQAAAYNKSSNGGVIPSAASWPDWRPPFVDTNAATSVGSVVTLRRYRAGEGLAANINTLGHELLHALNDDPHGWYFTDFSCCEAGNDYESAPYGFDDHFESIGCEVVKKAGGSCDR